MIASIRQFQAVKNALLQKLRDGDQTKMLGRSLWVRQGIRSNAAACDGAVLDSGGSTRRKPSLEKIVSGWF
jgi:hypothetical protein